MTRTAKIPGNDADLRVALRDVNLPNLLMVMVQLSGDKRWLDARYAPQGIVAPEGSMFPDDGGGYAACPSRTLRSMAKAPSRISWAMSSV